ncbi:scaffold protein [Clostridia bacterium]|nr:scaffold protein [Clostridia bacterium]
MDLTFLTGLGVTPENAAKIIEENGKDITAAELTAKKEQIDEIKTKTGDKSDGGELARLQKALDESQAENEKIKRNAALKEALSGYNFHNADVAMKLLDADKLKQKNGEFAGLDEQIQALREKSAFLFTDNPPNKAGSEIKGGSNTAQSGMNEFIRSL